jgi:catechol 2,3-dioxygenase-like lactoylglutathione lyase family enzyme
MVSSRRSFIKRAIGAGASASALAAAGAGCGAQAQPGGGEVRGFDHVALPMQNVEAMLAFYGRLGFRVNEGAQSCSVHFGTQMINFHRPSLWQNATFTLRAPAAKPPCGDLCFVWDGTPESLKAMLEKASAKVITGPVSRLGGRQTTGSSVYVRDPDENLLEFIIYS